MNEQTKSLWVDRNATSEARASLSGDADTDVVIVGAGVTGLTAALELLRSGKRVIVVEAKIVGGGESLRTTSHLTEAIDQRFYHLAKSFGDETAILMAQGHRLAIEKIESYVREFHIDCGFSRLDAYLFAAADDKAQMQELERETEVCRRLGLNAQPVDSVADLPFPIGGALKFADQGQVEPAAYLRGLANQVETLGGRIVENTRVLSVDDSERCKVVTELGNITADHVVVAAHTPIHTKLQFHATVQNYRTYVVAKPWPASRPLPMLWDLAEPYNYIRTQQVDGELFLIVGGQDHKVGEGPEDAEPLRRLEEYVAVHWGGGDVTHRWSGQIIETTDGLAYVGPTRPGSNVLTATGYSGNGYTYGTLAGLVLSDLVCGRSNRWASILSPTRMPTLDSVGETVAHNLSVAKHFVADRRPEEGSLSSLTNGCGKILKLGGEKLAVYRDDQGQLHTLSPVCPHMGCFVQWNGTERSWDCPCHGSRFTATGCVVNGPAVKDLEQRTVKSE